MSRPKKPETFPITIHVTAAQYRRNIELARGAGLTPSKHAAALFVGSLAFHDDDLAEEPEMSAISAALILHGNGVDRDTMAKTLRVTPDVVGRIIDRWTEATGAAQ